MTFGFWLWSAHFFEAGRLRRWKLSPLHGNGATNHLVELP
jgi:hypothetical protein